MPVKYMCSLNSSNYASELWQISRSNHILGNALHDEIFVSTLVLLLERISKPASEPSHNPTLVLISPWHSLWYFITSGISKKTQLEKFDLFTK